MSYTLSKKEIVAEILKCGKDPVYFIDNYARISHPIEGLIPFKTYPYQADLVQDFNDYSSLCCVVNVVSSRQKHSGHGDKI